MKTTIKIIGSVWIICTLIMILSECGKKRYRVSQLKGKWKIETDSPRPIRIFCEYMNGTNTMTYLQHGDTLIQAKYGFYLSDSVVTAFDWEQVDARTSGEYLVTQYSEDLESPYMSSCSVYKILFLNQDSLVIQYIPKKGEIMIGGEPVPYKRIGN